jgi:hypothetical protein
MRITTARAAAIVLIACMVTSISAVACGGDGGGQTLEEYLGQYEAADNRAEEATDALEAQYAAVLSQTQLTDDNRPDVRAYFEQLGEIGQTYVDEISDLDPPDDAKDVHEASIQSYQQVLDLYQDARANIGQATSIGQLSALFSTDEIDQALDQANADCRALQQLADDNNVDVDFECRGDSGTPTADETAAAD